jgi:FkbM family methyltransferase
MTKQFNKFKQTRHGLLIYNKFDVYIGRSIDFYGEYSEGEIALFEKLMKPNIIILDIGANIGAFTLFFAKAVEPNGVVYAFEPQRLIFQTLAGNMAINSVSNVYCINKAVGKQNGKIKIAPVNYFDFNNFGGISIKESESGEEVEIITIDSLNLPACHFIKIDVEGMETDVIKGAQNTITQFRPVMYVENDRKAKSSGLIAFIKSLNYDVYSHCPPLFNPDNFYCEKENIFDNIVSMNNFCIPTELNVTIQGIEKI